ncbi:MAG TPA: radical SAM protein [Acidimicrobiales bacterium]|nr:radical SAM protein [Acidimicrobiales bacterium]
MGGGEVPPIKLREVDVNVSNLCNLTCIHCSYASTPDKGEPSLPGGVIHRLLDEAADLGTRAVHWSGGEPLIRRDLDELVAHGSSLGLGMRVLSNGILLSPERLARLWDAGLRKIFVSLDGLEASHDHHRGRPGLYAQTLRGIESSLAAGFNVRVNAAATTLNVQEMPELLVMLARMGVHIFTVFYLIPVGRGADIGRLMVPPARWRRMIEELREAGAAVAPSSMEVAVEKVFWWEDEWSGEGPRGEGRGGGCLGFLNGCDYVNILSDGSVYPCVCFIDVAPPLGNILDRPLADVLHDPAGWDFYWSMRELNPTCTACPKVDACQGGSRAASRVLGRGFFDLDPRCTGDPVAQGFIPLCFMLRENVSTAARGGFAWEVVSGGGPGAPA